MSSTRLFAGSVTFKNMDDMLDSFKEEALLVSFHADNCGPCRLQKRELSQVAKLIRVVAIDTEKWPAVGSRFGVRKLPCLVIMKGGAVLAKLEGLSMADTIMQQLSTTLPELWHEH